FHVAILDAQHRLDRDITVSRGVLDASLVHPREVFREAIAERAAALILVHNHPSGDPTPSAEDRLVTEQLVAAGRLLGIPVHDHVIIGRGRYVSFAEAGLL
ncbi:MAG: JAB domain-containing protein, partial [Gemmatimonadota bacterium]